VCLTRFGGHLILAEGRRKESRDGTSVELPPEQIARSVRGTYEDYAQSTVRDFVPILVEGSVRERLPSSPPRHRA
jgi:hypothetical protein